MFELLRPLAAHGVSMTRFESRPSKMSAWEYLFFIDIEGHYDMPSLQEALDTLKQEALLFKLLGSYPVALL
jgi:chorismate mutase/prephenate dehydratase